MLLNYIKSIIFRRKQMGRPRKTEENTTSVETVNVETTEPVVEVPMNNVALGMAKNKNTGLWHVIRIPYNSEQLVAGTPEMAKEGEIRAIVMERFKIMASLDVLSNE